MVWTTPLRDSTLSTDMSQAELDKWDLETWEMLADFPAPTPEQDPPRFFPQPSQSVTEAERVFANPPPKGYISPRVSYHKSPIEAGVSQHEIGTQTRTSKRLVVLLILLLGVGLYLYNYPRLSRGLGRQCTKMNRVCNVSG